MNVRLWPSLVVVRCTGRNGVPDAPVSSTEQAWRYVCDPAAALFVLAWRRPARAPCTTLRSLHHVSGRHEASDGLDCVSVLHVYIFVSAVDVSLVAGPIPSALGSLMALTTLYLHDQLTGMYAVSRYCVVWVVVGNFDSDVPMAAFAFPCGLCVAARETSNTSWFATFRRLQIKHLFPCQRVGWTCQPKTKQQARGLIPHDIGFETSWCPGGRSRLSIISMLVFIIELV